MTSLLVRTYFRGNGGLAIMGSMVGKGRKRSKGAVIASYIGIIYLALIYMYIIFSRASASLNISVTYTIAEMHAAALSFSILFTLTSVDNVLVKGRDLPILRSLPITDRQLVLSRFVILYTEVFIESLMVFLPFLVASAISGITSIAWYLLIAADIFILPCFSVCFMAVFSYLGARYRLIYRIKTALIWILASLLIIVMLRELGGMQDAESLIIEFNGTPEVSGSSLILFSVVVLLTALLSLLFFAADIRLSHLAREASPARQWTGKAHVAGYRQHTLFNAMLLREWRIIFSHSAIATEILMELFIPAVLIAVYAVMGIAGNLLEVVNIPGIQPYLGLAATGVIMLCFSFCLLSSTSVSREGKDYEATAAYPVDSRLRADVKIVFHLIMVLPVQLLFLIISYIFFKVEVWQAVMMIGTAAFLTADFSAIGLIIDFRNPHTDWDRPQEAVKQNLNGLGASGISFFILLLIVLIAFLLEYFVGIRLLTLAVILILPGLLFLPLRSLALKAARGKEYKPN